MFDELKHRHRQVRDGYPENLNLRIHRALSWLKAAESSDDIDGKFIFLWVAFNAAYAFDVDDRYRTAEHEAFNEFISKLCLLDKSRKLENLIWNEFPGAIRSLLKNQYIFPRFWDFQKGKLSDDEWQADFSKANAAAHKALGSRETEKVIAIILSRIYTLRNQIVHGGSTWGSKVNRQQLQDCAKLMGCFIPIIIEIMLESPDTLWGDACYPVIEG
jgi:hypothetical protein